MRLTRPALAVISLVTASALLTPASAPATAETAAQVKAVPRAAVAPAAVTAPCSMRVGAFDASGVWRRFVISASKPPVAGVATSSGYPVMRDLATFQDVQFDDWQGLFLSGSALFAGRLLYDPVDYVYRFSSTRLGGGWGSFTAIETANGRAAGTYLYGLRDDGVLFRWIRTGQTFRALGSAPGFTAVKTMTVISETATYDTLLANTRSGGLYTIRIPVASPMKPVVKQIRKSTWQGFEGLVAERCGTQSTLLTAVDHETSTPYLYAVGHANGLSTVIQGLGVVPPLTMRGPAYHLMTREAVNLFGE